MWAPWVVITVFLLVLAFTHWFLQPPRAAEMGRLYRRHARRLLCSLLLTVDGHDPDPAEPAHRHPAADHLHGRVQAGPAARADLGPDDRLHGARDRAGARLRRDQPAVSLADRRQRRSSNTESRAVKAKNENRMTECKLSSPSRPTSFAPGWRPGCRSRARCRSSTRAGTPHAMGIDVGQEQSMKEPRSHIEGATPSTAIWSFGIVPDPFSPPGPAAMLLDRRIPVEDFLPCQYDRVVCSTVCIELKSQIAADRASEAAAQRFDRREAAQLDAQHQPQPGGARPGSSRVRAKRKRGRRPRRPGGRRPKRPATPTRPSDCATRPPRSHRRPITVEMTFNVYRTTKGKVGEPVYAEIAGDSTPAPAQTFEGDIFPIKEYYTNRSSASCLDPGRLAGRPRDRDPLHQPDPVPGNGRERPVSAAASSGNFGVNYMKGLLGVWLQAMVLTAIGVFAGTFLSWPVALLTTIVFFVAGQLAFAFLVDFTRQAMLGGGPFESLDPALDAR